MSAGAVRGHEVVLEQTDRGRGDVGGLRAVSRRGARYEKKKKMSAAWRPGLTDFDQIRT